MSLTALDRDVLRGLQASIKPFNGGEGFTAWKDAMKLLMDGYEYLEAVEQDVLEEQPDEQPQQAKQAKQAEKKEKETKEEEWRRKNKQAKILLHSCVGPSLKSMVFAAKSAHEAWMGLCKRFERRGIADALRLQRELINKTRSRRCWCRTRTRSWMAMPALQRGER